MEQPFLLRRFKSNKVSEMEDLISAGHDIKHVTFLTKKAFDVATGENVTDPLLRLYFENALITYARPFATGVRNRLHPEDIFGDTDGALDYHKYLIEQRNKLVAHNVNPFEETTVGVLIDSKNQLTGVGNLTGRLVAFIKNDYGQFNGLANTVLRFINEKLRELEREVLSQARQLSPEELSKLETVQFTVPGPELVSRSKRKA
jgi:hypothetical protein